MAASLPKIVGKHEGCGGSVLYSVHGNLGYRYCDKCRASTLRGNPMETEEEAARRRSHNDKS